MQFVLASHNQKKLAELSDILRGLNLSILPLPEGAPEPVEDGDSFEANARIKARAAFEYTGLPAIADDSGLVVDALNGAPGVRSARYCPGSDADRNAFLLENLAGVDDCERQARFVCAICCVLPDGQEITVRAASATTRCSTCASSTVPSVSCRRRSKIIFPTAPARLKSSRRRSKNI